MLSFMFGLGPIGQGRAVVNVCKQSAKKSMRAGRVFLLAGCALLASSAEATTVIRSSAYGVQATLSVQSVLKAQVGPLVPVSGIAGQVYDQDGTLPSLNTTLGLGSLTGLKIGTGLITTGADSAFPVAQTASADALVNGFSLGLTEALGVTSLGLTANTIISHSEVEGNGDASATGSSKISGLKLTVQGVGLINLGASEFITAAPNTDLLALYGLNAISGLKIIVNEQIPRVGSNAKFAGVTTNAIHLIFNDYLLGTDRLVGDVIVSYTKAYINDANSATPEPATWVQMITGFGLIGAAARQRRRAIV